MGLSPMKGMDAVIPNVTKCLTWQDVKASHAVDENQVVIKLNDIRGMMIILVVVLIGATIIVFVECLVRKLWFKKASQSTGKKSVVHFHTSISV